MTVNITKLCHYAECRVLLIVIVNNTLHKTPMQENNCLKLPQMLIITGV